MWRFGIRDLLWLTVVVGLATVVVRDRWQDYTTPVMLDGYCPVTLVRDRAWQRGDVAWQTIYDGKKYLFASQADLQLFQGTPSRFAPVNSGNDPVRLADEKRKSPGFRSNGVMYHSRIYLFDSEETLKAFSDNPAKYAQP